MSELTLSDLDEMVLMVRDRVSRTYINEAIVAYRGRAYRAAVVSTWVAVVFDIISKVRELAGQGEGAAVALVTDLDAAITAKDVKKLQGIENELLDKATTEFEFLSRREAEDLGRLKSDRNECAHPAFTGEATLFSPTPELVRVHIVHAIEYLLCHPPVQGKSALTRLKADILQPSFPIEQDQVSRFLDEKYLKHGKNSFVDTLVTVLLKVLIRHSDADLKLHPLSLIRCLKAIADIKPRHYEAQMATELPKACDAVADTQITILLTLLIYDLRVWGWLDEPTRLRLKRIVAGSGSAPLDTTVWPRLWPILVLASQVPDLIAEALFAFRSLPTATQEMVIASFPRPAWADEIAPLYAGAGAFRRAESLGNTVVLPMAPFLSAAQIAGVLQAVRSNSQIWYAGGTAEVLNRLFDLTASAKPETRPAWQDLMAFLITQADSPEDHYAYPELRRRLEAKGWWPLPAPVVPVAPTAPSMPPAPLPPPAGGTP